MDTGIIILLIILFIGTLCVVFQRPLVDFLFRYCSLGSLLDKLNGAFLSHDEKERLKQKRVALASYAVTSLKRRFYEARLSAYEVFCGIAAKYEAPQMRYEAKPFQASYFLPEIRAKKWQPVRIRRDSEPE